MVGSAVLGGVLLPRLGTKPLFLLAMGAIPLRGTVIILLLTYFPKNTIALLVTQTLDGLAGGLVGLLTVLLAENLTRGTGRFALVYGIARTCDVLGGSFSNLIAQTVAEYYGYKNAFLFLSVTSLIPIVLYSVAIPSATVSVDGKLEAPVLDL